MLDRSLPDAAERGPAAPLAAPPRSPHAGLPGAAARWLALGLVASALLHAGVVAALLLWPVRDPIEEPGEIGSVALVFDDTAAQAGGGAVDQAPPPAPPAPPVIPAPPAPPAETVAAAPPPPPPAPAAAAPPAPPAATTAPVPPVPPVAPDAPRDFAALPPDPAGELPAPPPAPAEPVAAPPPAGERPEPLTPAEQHEPPPLPHTEVAQEPPPPETRQQASAQPLPLPPPPPPVPPQQAAAQPAPPPRPPSRQAAPPMSQGPVRLDAGTGTEPDPSMGSFALGAVMPPGTDAGHRNTPPDYPAEARRRGEEGVVRLSLHIAPDGKVTAAEVATSSGFPALDRAAAEAARRWRFRPATRAGVPVAATLPTAVHFRLSDGRGR